ncbi:protein TASOR 2 isoform X6 [Erinaceus europaeus]|uniref:Protein TASOR 2 isoform X6 n=1 Tax=Erinaceus europaeus TaxID=9365 RepID=A0ABM3XHT2_ERIEU|nr:protein TASOR 2 isoform X6 [Erinaceus europaeus]
MSFFRPPGGIFDINREQDYAKNSGGILGEHELRPPSQPHYPLETTETGLISEQIFETVPLSTDSLFQRAISVLHTAYLDSASGLGFQYNQVTLVKNDIFLNEYKHFHQEKKANNYTQEELEETYGFLLFQTEKQAKLACQRGLCVGSSAVTTLGDPARGVYISKYSDYLHARPWYHGKSGYIVVFKLIKGKVKFVSENYTTNYTSPSSGYDCHVATDANKVSQKTSHFRTFELSQYYLYELAGSTVTQRPRQICPYVIVAFQYREPKKMATPAPQSILELSENVLTTQWKGKLTIQGCLLCDVTLWPFSGAVIPEKLSHELDFKYLMKVSSLKKRLPEAAFRKQNDLKQRVFCQDICFSIYEVELSNKQGKKIDKLTKFMKNKQLAIIKSLEDRGFFILLTSSALISETDFGDRHTDLWGLHLFHSPLLPGLNVLKVENDISLKVMPILPVLNCVLLEAKKAVAEGVCPNTLVKRSFQELHRMDRSTSSTASPQDGVREAAFSGQPSSDLDLMPPAEKCPLQSFAQLQSYFSNPSGYVLEVSAALDLLAERPQSPCVSDGICDAGFSLVMTPDSEFLDVEADVRKETEPEDSEDTRQEGTAPLSTASNLRVQPKRKASMPHGVQSEKVNLCRPCPKRTPPAPDKAAGSATTLKLIKGQFPQKRKRGAEVLTAQFVQTTKLDRKSQEAPFTKDAPVTANAKKTKKQEKTPSRSVPKAKPPVKKPPQKPVKDNQTPRGRKQPQPAARGLGLWIQNEQEEMFARENHRDTPGNQNFIYSCNSEIIGQVATESADTPETASLLLSGIASTQPCIPGEDQSFTPLDSARVTSYSDTVRQTAATKTYSGTGGQSVTYPKTVYSALENKVDIFHAVEQTHTGALEDLLRNSSPIDKDFDKADSTGYVLINLEPATLTYVPIQAEVGSRIDKPLSLTLELTEQVLHSATLGHSVPSLEKTQAPVLRNISSVLGSEQSTNYLCASSASKALAGEMCSLQAEIPTPDSTLTSDTSLVAEALPLMKSAKHSVPAQEMMISQELLLQSQCVHSLPSEEVRELSQVEEVVSATLQKNHSLSCLPSPTNISNDALHLKNKSGMDGENTNRESFRSTLSKQTGLSVSREEANPRGPEDPDIDLILTITPSKSREERPSGKIEQRQEAPLANRELQSVAKEITESGKTAFRDNREVSCAPCTVGKPLENEQSNRNLAPVTLFPEETWTLEEITEEVNISSGLPFGSFIEEVSPVSSPDPLLPAAEARPPQTVCPATLKLSDTQCEKSDTLPQPESEGLTLTEEGNASIGPAPLGGQDTLTQEVPAQLCAGSPPGLSDHPGGKDLVPSGKVTTEIVPEIFSEKVPCHNKDSNQPALADSYREDLGPSVEKTVTSRNPPQLLSVEKNHLDVKSLVSETSELPVSPRKMKESETLTAEFVPADRLNVSFKQQTSPRDAEKALSSGDSKTHEDSYLQVSTLSSCSRGEVACALAHTSSGSPRQACPPSDGPPHGHCGGREFQTREISVVRMASLLKNCETEAEVREQNRGLRSIGSQSSFMPPEDEPDPRHVVQDIPACAAEALKGGFFPVYTGSYQNTAGPAPSISEEPSASFAPEACDPPICGVFQELEGNKNPEGGLTLEEELGTLTEGVAVSANFDIHHEPISEDSDKGSCDCGSPKSDVEDPCTLQHRCTKKEGPLKEDCDSFLHLHTNDNEDWDYPPQTPGLETSIPSRNWYLGLKQEEKYRPSYIQIRDLRGIPRTYANFTITKQLQDTTRTLHSLGRQPDRTAHCSLLSSWIDSWHVSDDLTQNTLDMEYLRFAHSMKQTAKGRDPPRSASSTKLFARESPLHISAAAFPLTERPESQLLHPAARSRSPLLITVTHSDARQQNLPRRDRRPTSLGSPSFWMEKDDHCQNHFMNLDRSPTVPLHLNKLRYNSTSKDSRNDISLILSEYAEFDKVVMNSSPAVFPGKGASVSRGPTPQELCSSFPRKAASYEDMITDLCTSLHVKLKHVMKEACKSTFLFYLVETGDKSFFVRTKNILRKSGHTEIEPQHLCQGFPRENETLIVIIRNEDISSRVHQIPSLLRLKHCANVIFAGVDSPEDILEYSYQELFQTGGFVVSDDKILETLSLVQLKEVVKTLEKLNGNGRWKWLLHYREHKKLKECGRVDSAARKKNTILKSCQSVNIVELLHYHQCDSRSAAKGEYLNCLLSLQTQHIHARFAVFLTEKPMVSREVFENSGILVTDVSNFVENIQKVAAPLRSSCW